jgi:hypothetical protein
MITMAQITRIFVLLSLFAGSSANANPVGFAHYQSTLGEELIATIHCTIYPCALTTRIFDVFNQTDTVWTDYHLRLESATNTGANEPEDSNDPIFLTVSALTVFATTIFSGTSAEFLDGSVLPLSSFQFVSQVTEQDQSIETYRLYGRPSYVPLPSTLVLFALGLAGLMARRKA